MVLFTNSMKDYYTFVLQDRIDLLKDKHVFFPNIVLDCSLNDDRLDVAHILLNNRYKPTYKPMFKNTFITDVKAAFGYTRVSTDSYSELNQKFRCAKLLLDFGACDLSIIPSYLKEDFVLFCN